MGHVGLTPQSINTMGGFRVQGAGEEGQSCWRPMPVRSPRRALSRSSWRGLSSRCPRRHPVHRRAHDRDRRVARLRRSDPRAGRHAGLERLGAEICEEFGSLREQIEAAVADYASEVRAGTFPARSTSTSRRSPEPGRSAPLLPLHDKVSRVRAASRALSAGPRRETPAEHPGPNGQRRAPIRTVHPRGR